MNCWVMTAGVCLGLTTGSSAWTPVHAQDSDVPATTNPGRRGTASERANLPTVPVPLIPGADDAADESGVQEAPTTDEDSQLQEILVTAQKRRESLQDVPLSVRALSGEQVTLLRANGADVRFLSARVPSLTIESSFGRTFPRFYIRGLGNTDFDLNASQPVSMILDEVVLENPILKGFPIFDLDRVEVLRGPQGTLFGRNTPAGIVKFESKKPTPDFEAYGRATYGSFDFIGLEAAVSGPVIQDILSTRLSILYERRGDYVDNTLTGEEDAYEGFEDVAGRFQVLFTPGERFRALINLHAHSLEGTARLFRANIVEQGTEDFVDGFARDRVSIDGTNDQSITQLGLVGNLQYDFGSLTLTSISGYESLQAFSRGDIDGGFGADFAPPSGPGFIPFPSETADGIPRLRQFTQEVRLATNNWNRFNFQVGGFLFYEELDIDTFSYDTLGGGAQNGRAIQRQDTTAFAGFASLSVDILQNLRLAGGVRLSRDEKDFRAERIQAPGNGVPLGPLTANPEDTFLSGDASLFYGLTDDISLYTRVARGFRAPSIQGRVLFGDAISVADSESILSAEGGVKSEFFNRRARLNLAGFYYELSDQQLTAVGGTTNVNTLLNSDKSVGFGFEADAQVIVLSNLAVSLGVSFNSTEIQDDQLAIAPCGAACTVLDPEVTPDGPVLLNGNPLPHAPKWIVNAIIRYDFPIGDQGELFFYGDLAYRSRINFFLYESAEFTDASLLEIGARLGYTRFDGGFEAAIFSRNINNDLSRTGGIDFNNLTGYVNEPRTWGIEARFRF